LAIGGQTLPVRQAALPSGLGASWANPNELKNKTKIKPPAIALFIFPLKASLRNLAVKDLSIFISSSGLQEAMSSPPLSPPSGPGQ